MNCPHCRTNLLMSERQGVEIDYCPDCRGVWLDRGELDKIIAKTTAEEEALRPVPRDDRDRYATPPPQYRDDGRGAMWSAPAPPPSGDTYAKKRKSKSFLTDIFDF